MLVLADGTVVDPNDVVIGADGVVRTKDGKILAGVSAKPKTLETADGTVISGLNINEDGMVVLEDGTLVDPNDLVVTSDGRIFTKDGKEVKGGTVGIAVDGLRQNPDGSIVTASGAIIKGATLNEDGMLVLADGTIVDPNDVIIRPDGTIVTKSGKVIEGLSADTSAVANLAGGISSSVDYIVGGVSTDGVADVKKVPVEEDK
jgi:pilus assembly protein CpaB